MGLLFLYMVGGGLAVGIVYSAIKLWGGLILRLLRRGR